MTREDIKTINDIVHKTIYGFFDICGDEETPMTDKDKLLLEVNKAVCNNIKDLEQEPCEDAISRTEFIVALMDSGIDHLQADNLIEIGQIVFGLPSVQPSRPTGHWIGIDDEPHEDYECNRCGYVCSTFTANIRPYEEYKYCPKCGAKMEG